METLFSKNLKYLRAKHNMSQEQLAKKIGRTRKAIGNWEAGIREPKAIDAFAICDIFSVTIDDLATIDLSLEEEKIILNDDEKDLICKYRELSDAQKQAIRNMIEAF